MNGSVRLAVAGGLLALASGPLLPRPAFASEPPDTTTTTTEAAAAAPGVECVGFACLDEHAASAVVFAGVLTAGVLSGRALFGGGASS